MYLVCNDLRINAICSTYHSPRNKQLISNNGDKEMHKDIQIAPEGQRTVVFLNGTLDLR